jgi:glucose/arabinose dehydrogenase
MGGYKIVFQPFNGAKVSGTYEVFADNFAGMDPLMKREEAKARPAGLAQAVDGSIYISDMVKGRIWRVVYRGGAASND